MIALHEDACAKDIQNEINNFAKNKTLWRSFLGHRSVTNDFTVKYCEKVGSHTGDDDQRVWLVIVPAIASSQVNFV